MMNGFGMNLFDRLVVKISKVEGVMGGIYSAFSFFKSESLW